MTDLWFDYAPAKKKGVRKFEYLYIFIKYKTKEEMRDVRAYHDRYTPDDEVIKTPKTFGTDSHKSQTVDAAKPFDVSVLDMKYRKAITEIKGKAEYSSYEEKLSNDEKNILNDVFTYMSKILTGTSRREQAEAALESLNRIIENNGGLKTFALGMCMKFKELLSTSTTKKSAQYYRTVVYNDIIENSAAIIMQGQAKLDALNNSQAFKFDISVFEE